MNFDSLTPSSGLLPPSLCPDQHDLPAAKSSAAPEVQYRSDPLRLNYAGATSAKTPEAVRNRALDITASSERCMRPCKAGLSLGLRIRRISTEYATPFQVKVVDMIFYTEFHDYTAQ